MTFLSRTHALVNAALGAVGLQIQRAPRSMPAAPELPPHLLSDCRVLGSRAQLLAALPKNGNVAEIGVADGDFSEQIIRISTPKLLYLVDAWGSARYRIGLDRVKARFKPQIVGGQVRIERGLSSDAMKNIPEGSLDWIYIDTVHDYVTTKLELAIAANLVKPGGYIAGHDFCIGNPAMALPYGVIPAVCEFCLERGFRLAYITLAADGFLSFCLSAPDVGELGGNGNTREVSDKSSE